LLSGDAFAILPADPDRAVTTVSAVQSAIALEALVSAAFILISSKLGHLFGRKRAYVLGLLAYAIGALAMTLAQSLIRAGWRVAAGVS